jgi:hypothetical protein
MNTITRYKLHVSTRIAVCCALTVLAVLNVLPDEWLVFGWPIDAYRTDIPVNMPSFMKIDMDLFPYYWQGHWSYVGIGGNALTGVVIIIVVGCICEWRQRIREATGKQSSYLQFSLMTAILVMLLASVVVWLNVSVGPEDVYRGWPYAYELRSSLGARWNLRSLAEDVTIAVTALIAWGAACEFIMRRRYGM